MWMYFISPEFEAEIRKLDKKLSITTEAVEGAVRYKTLAAIRD